MQFIKYNIIKQLNIKIWTNTVLQNDSTLKIFTIISTIATLNNK